MANVTVNSRFYDFVEYWAPPSPEEPFWQIWFEDGTSIIATGDVHVHFHPSEIGETDDTETTPQADPSGQG